MAAQCSTTTSHGIRNPALIVLLYRTGLRIGEALALRPKDVNPEIGSVTVRQGKANRRCTTGIDMRVHPHRFGLTRAYELMTEGVPMPIIQQQLGYASLPRLVW